MLSLHLYVYIKKDSSSTLEKYTAIYTHCARETLCQQYCIAMLTVTVQDCNRFSQEFYNSVIISLQLPLLKCKCGHSGCLTIHGYYPRSVITPSGKITLSICRVICSECGHTHALLLSSMVPYSQIPAEDQRRIVEDYESKSDPNASCSGDGIDENNVKSVIRRYVKSWKERITAESISLRSLRELTNSCFAYYSMQFMQIRMTANKLVPSPT